MENWGENCRDDDGENRIEARSYKLGAAGGKSGGGAAPLKDKGDEGLSEVKHEVGESAAGSADGVPLFVRAGVAADVGDGAADESHNEEENKGEGRVGDEGRVGEVKERRADSGGEPALDFTEKDCPDETDGVAGLEHRRTRGGGDGSDFNKIGRDKNERSENADLRKVADG